MRLPDIEIDTVDGKAQMLPPVPVMRRDGAVGRLTRLDRSTELEQKQRLPPGHGQRAHPMVPQHDREAEDPLVKSPRAVEIRYVEAGLQNPVDLRHRQAAAKMTVASGGRVRQTLAGRSSQGWSSAVTQPPLPRLEPP